MADDLKPCPFCNAEMQFEESGYEHPYSDTCPLDSLYIEDGHVAAWNSRATPTVQEAAKVLLDALNTSDGFAAATNAAIPILRADINETAWNTPDEVVSAISAAVRAIAGDIHD